MRNNMEMLEKQSSKDAVRIHGAYKAYDSKTVILKGLNMVVPKGVIYGLLGPSGCGKTTLINCIVGQLELDSGSIETIVRKRSEFGYMPQNVSLQGSLTVYENLCFYGYLTGMPKKCVEDKAIELMSLLQIPSAGRLVKTLSGGQQRRVSIAVSLLHDPILLILDEPTVGLDPILRKCIWDHLLKLASDGKSIIITTHYIQEAQQAHVIGLLREGVLLTEDSPCSLMESCHCDNLEDAFLKLTVEQEKDKSRKMNITMEKMMNTQPFKQYYKGDGKLISMRRFEAMLYKNIALLIRDLRFILFMILLPITVVLLFNLTIGMKPVNLKIVVVNKESSCADHSSYDSCFLDENSTLPLSCLYLDVLRNLSYNLINYVDLDAATKEVKTNKKMWALLYFNERFSSSLVSRINNWDAVTDLEITNSFLQAWIDYSDQYIGTFIKYDLVKSISPLFKDAFLKCNLNLRLANSLTGVDFNTPIFGSDNVQFITYSSAALLCLCSMFYPSFATALYMNSERTSGIIERMSVSGATIMEIMISMGCIQFVIHIFQTVVNMFIMYYMFANPLYGSVTTFYFLQLLSGTCGILYGLILSLLMDNIIFVGIVSIGYHMALCLTTGLIWPVEGAHDIIKTVNFWAFPLGDAVNAVRGIASKNFDFIHPVVLRGFISIITWHFIFLFVIIAIIKLRKNVFLAKTVY